MPTGKLREERTLNHHEEKAKLLDDFFLTIEAAGQSARRYEGRKAAARESAKRCPSPNLVTASDLQTGCLRLLLRA